VFAAALLVLATFATYLPVSRAGFVWDDALLLEEHALVTSADGLLRCWDPNAKGNVEYQPITVTARWVLWRMWGGEPTGHHLVNVGFHALTAVLLWLVLIELGVPVPWLCSLVYAVHPVCVASVAWVAELKNVLAQRFYLAAALAFLVFERERRPGWYWLSVCAFGLAGLSKGSVVMFSVVLLLYLWYRQGRLRWLYVRRTLPYFFVSAAIGGLTVWVQYEGDLARQVGFMGGPATRLARTGWIVWFYLLKSVLPTQLAMTYPQWTVDASNPAHWLPLAALLLVFGFLWRRRNAWGRHWLFGLGGFVVSLFPVLGFAAMKYMQYSWVSDHLAYLAMLSIVPLLVGSAASVAARSSFGRPVAVGLAAIVLVSLGGLTWDTSAHFVNRKSLWSHALRTNPTGHVPQRLLARALLARRETAAAVPHLRRAIEADPGREDALLMMGQAHYMREDYGKAAYWFRRLLRRNPKSAEAYAGLALILKTGGNLRAAAAHLNRAVQLDPGLAEAHFYLGEVMSDLGRPQQAVRSYLESLRLNPRQAEARNNVGVLLFQRGNLKEAEAHFERAVLLRPDYADAYSNFGSVLARRGRLAEAVGPLSRAVELRPELAGARWMLGEALAKLGRTSRALAHLKEAVRLAPNRPEVLHSYARLVALSPAAGAARLEEALTLCQKARGLAEAPVLLDTLVLLYARNGQFDQAIATALRARELAAKAGKRTLASAVDMRLAVYREGRAPTARELENWRRDELR